MTALHVRRPRLATLFAVLVTSLLLVPLFAALPAQAQTAEGRVLLFTETAAFRHSEAITQGVPVLESAFADAGIETVHTEDSSIFNDTDLATFDALVMFQASGDPWTAAEKAALEAYQQSGGGIVGIHNATDMRGDYAWWDDLVGTLMPGHAATGTSPGQPGTVLVEDRVHPSTEHLPQDWARADEWYNYDVNVRGDAHVLATMDESTYDPGGNAMGYDHPISWCKPYDGGRAWLTGMGHFGAHYTDEPDFVQHIVGGVEWAAGLAEGDCGGTDWSEYERVTLDSNTSAPFAMDVAADGRVFFTELVRGQIRVYDPATQTTETAVELDVYSGGEDGLLGIALDPDFADNGHVFVYWAPDRADNSDPASFFSRVSRFTMDDTGTIDPASEELVIEFPSSRLPDEPGHTGGGLRFGPGGNLYISIGDDVNPHSEPSGGYAPLHESSTMLWDARATSSNTNDLRGKLLRIHPEADGSYTIPDGNLIDTEWAADKDTDLIRPEIYAMGFRNPFRFFVDPVTGDVGLADYSPDNNNDAPATRGPAGIAEWNWITEAGNYGWPLCMGANEPFRDVDYLTSPVTVGDFFDCDAPINDSIHNTGLTELPPVQPADVYYGYQRASDQGSGLNQGGGLAPMGGPTYHFDESLDSDTKFPEYYDGKPFFYEWARNRMFSFVLDETATTDAYEPGQAVEKVNPFLPQTQFLAPIDSLFGPDGSLYVLDWGGGFGRDNPNSGLHRIDYISGSRSPIAQIDADPESGQAPLEVTFSGARSSDPEGASLSYAWDFDADGIVDATGVDATHTYDEVGVYDARLTVTDPEGKVGTATVPITVGNTEPDVEVETPPDGAFFDFGSTISWEVDVTDAEDTIDPDDVIVQPALGHDGHAHPTTEFRGLTGSVETSLGGHAPDENIFFVIDARYTDAGANGQPPLTSSDTVAVYPRLKEAEFADDREGITVSESRDVAGHGEALGGSDGAWFSHDPVNLANIDALTVRAAASEGGPIELRMDAPDGPLLGTADVPATGLTRFVDVTVDVTDPGESFTLYVVMPGPGERRVNFIEAVGQGLSDSTVPTVEITSPEPYAVIDEVGEVTLTADASDPDNGIEQVEFLVDDESVGTDTTAPFEVTWTPDEEGRYVIEAIATSTTGVTTTSRAISIDVGDLFAGWQTYSHEAAAATFERPDSDTWIIESGGANMWTSADEYGAAFQPAAAEWDQWTATVRLDSHESVSTSGKAGIMVRNDITAAGSSGGYVYLGARNSTSGLEWMQDLDGNGLLDASQNGGAVVYPQWMRVTRDGDTYQAWRSADGENWTEVGDPATVDSAAAVQDVGVAVTAHSTSGRATAQFSNFSIVEGLPDEPQEPEYEPFPACAVGSADDFEGDALDTGTWTTVREADGDPVSVSDGALHLPVTAGDINEGSTGPISYVARPAPAGEWTFTTEVSLEHTREWQHAGLLLHASDDEYVKLAWTQGTSGAPFLEFQTETAGSRTWHANNVALAGGPDTVHLQLTSDGSAITAAYSLDGSTWTDLSGSAPVKADATIGIMAGGDVTASEQVAHVESATLATADDDAEAPAPSDEFDGDALDTCRWNAIVRADASEVEVADGHLSITTDLGDINGTDNGDPRNMILQDAPDGDWTIETRMRAPLETQWQLAGLLAYGDDDNYVKLNVGARNAPGSALDLGTELVSEVDANFGAGGNRLLDVAETTESGYWYLRLAKEGDTYTGWVSDGGINWTQVGEPVTNAGDLDTFGLWAIGPSQQSPVTVDFDWFRVDGGDVVDDTAPEASATLLGTFTGAFTPTAGWDTAGTATLEVTEDGTTLSADLSGLEPDTTHQGHLHEDVCGAVPMGGHYQDDPDGVEEPPNELWLLDDDSDPAAGFTSDGDGEATVDGSAPWTAGSTAQSVYVHAGEFGLPRGCATLDTTSEPVEVVLDASDDVGVASVEYTLDGGEWIVYDGPFTVDEPGDHVVTWRATDAAGNTSVVGEASFTITEPLELDVVVDPTDPDGQDGWYVSPVTITASTNDDATIEFDVDGDGWVADDDGVLVVDTDGSHTVAVRAIRGGETTDVAEVAIDLDATAPGVAVDGVTDGVEVGSSSEVDVTVSADDATSGMASLVVMVDGEVVGEGTDEVSATLTARDWSLGDHAVTVEATDVAGNVTTTELSFTITTSGEDVLALIDQFVEEGALDARVARQVGQQVEVGMRHLDGGRTSQAAGAFQRALDRLQQVDDPEVREVLGANLRALVDDLG
ncbi:ThuA domain-containing protein [Salsipaludibacter albus]|uniref:ThuA domain-containing protein n=1 Tax=Salsipaludibacter albus TaxID=2849650 RepID=UPI001EE3E84D|nr:ThuA domain-containing protein [Salsipaludibacter albus]MBY5163860.1 ThuA domain-containing protein [Salsipaludibacter albus]